MPRCRCCLYWLLLESMWMHNDKHIELPAKLLDYFLRSNKRIINQATTVIHQAANYLKVSSLLHIVCQIAIDQSFWDILKTLDECRCACFSCFCLCWNSCEFTTTQQQHQNIKGDFLKVSLLLHVVCHMTVEHSFWRAYIYIYIYTYTYMYIHVHTYHMYI